MMADLKDNEELSDIQAYYKGKTLFISGASGFMGKVLLEKLLYSCNGLERIYILLRPKRGRTPEQRLDDMFKLPMFERLRNFQPNAFTKITPLNGDVTLPNLGLTTSQLDMLADKVNIVFHSAATLRLEAKLKDAVEMNTIGTASMLALARKMRKLEAFVHVSTAFCHVDQEELQERVYDAPDEPHEVMRLVKWLKEDALDLITPKLLEPHPNTYTYSKRLAENLVANEHPNIPCAIARPSIVTPAWEEPLPGWVDSLNGPVGLIVGAGKGVIRSMHCNGNYHAEVVAVDFAINALIAIGYKIGSTTIRQPTIPVVNITQSRVVPVTWADVLEKGKKIAYENPFEWAIWFPDGDIRSSKFIHNLFVFFFHIIPAYFIDFLMLIFRQKRFMIRIQRRISDGLEVLQYFTTRDWVFHNTNMLTLWQKLSPRDKQLFNFDSLTIDDMEYIKRIILGARQYCMKEKLETLPRARIHLKMLYVIHLITVYSFYYLVLSTIISNFEFTRYCLDLVTEKMKLLPILGRFVDRAAPS